MGHKRHIDFHRRTELTSVYLYTNRFHGNYFSYIIKDDLAEHVKNLSYVKYNLVYQVLKTRFATFLCTNSKVLPKQCFCQTRIFNFMGNLVLYSSFLQGIWVLYVGGVFSTCKPWSFEMVKAFRLRLCLHLRLNISKNSCIFTWIKCYFVYTLLWYYSLVSILLKTW